MLRALLPAAALLMMALSPAALAQKSSGYIDLEDMSATGLGLVVVRVLISETDATCPQQTGIFRIRPGGSVHDIQVLRKGDRYWRMDATPDPDDFTTRRRVETDSCRFDIDISEQQKRNDEWVPWSSTRVSAADDRTRKTDDRPAMSLAEQAAYDRVNQAQWHAGRLRQGILATVTSGTGFGGRNDCFQAVGTYLIDQGGLTMLFPTGLGGELNRFFIERVDADENRSTLYLSRGSCRVGFTVSASILREGSWVPLPMAPPASPKSRPGADKN